MTIRFIQCSYFHFRGSFVGLDSIHYHHVYVHCKYMATILRQTLEIGAKEFLYSECFNIYQNWKKIYVI